MRFIDLLKILLAGLFFFVLGGLIVSGLVFALVPDLQTDLLVGLRGESNGVDRSRQNSGASPQGFFFEDIDEWLLEEHCPDLEIWELGFYVLADADDHEDCPVPFTGYTPDGSELLFVLAFSLCPEGNIFGYDRIFLPAADLHIKGKGTFTGRQLDLTGAFYLEEYTDLTHTSVFHAGDFSIVADYDGNSTLNLNLDDSSVTLATDYEMKIDAEQKSGSCTYQSPELEVLFLKPY